MTSAPPFALAGIDHAVLLVNGMTAALDFYRRVLGCSVAQAVVEEGTRGGAMGETWSLCVRDPSGNSIELTPPA